MRPSAVAASLKRARRAPSAAAPSAAASPLAAGRPAAAAAAELRRVERVAERVAQHRRGGGLLRRRAVDVEGEYDRVGGGAEGVLAHRLEGGGEAEVAREGVRVVDLGLAAGAVPQVELDVTAAEAERAREISALAGSETSAPSPPRPPETR